jgi:TolB-like protein/Tfp pilus assembly protein PilF
MPFVNESGNADVEYLSDGMTESLINSLSQLPKLNVKARSSVFRYKGKDVEPQDIAAKLSVQALLNGRVIQRGDGLTLYLSLVDAYNGNLIWGEQYNRKLTDLVALQQEIARDVSNKLRVKLSSAEQQKLSQNHTENFEAYHLYLKGRFFWNRRTEEGLRKGLGYFEQALLEDPQYALAYIGLADSYNVLGFYSYLSPKESFLKAKVAAEKALKLNEELSEAHSSLAYAMLYYDWDFASAEREFRRAIELNPNYPIAHQWYGNLLTAMGRWDEALQEFKRAQELDPLSLVITAVPGWTYYYARQYDKAVEFCHKAIEMDRNFALAHDWLGQAYERKGMYEEAISEFKEALSLSGQSPEITALLAHAYAVSGNKRQAQAILDDMIELSQGRYVPPYHIATIYVGLGDKNQAFKWLNVAYNDRQNILVFLKHDARLDNLRDDPRYQDLLRRIGLPQ